MRHLVFAAALTFMMACSGASAEPEVTNITPQAAEEMAAKGEIILIDVRTPAEWAKTGVATGAVKLTLQDKDFVAKAKALAEQDDRDIAFICRSGNRSSTAAKLLAKAGVDAINVTEGMVGKTKGQGWVERGLPVETCCG